MAGRNQARSERGRTAQMALACLAYLLFFSVAASAQAVNTIKSIKTVQQNVEITVTSTKEFPARNELVVLRIADKEFSTSRSPEDGSLNVLIFILTSEEFGQVSTGDPVVARFGRDESGDQWNFGKLDKSMLNK